MSDHEDEERIELDRELNPIIVPTTLYEFFMANGREGLEAMQLWLHLVYMARRQATNQVWAQDTYLQTGLDWGERKIRTLRSWLQKHGLIEYVEPRRNQRGQFVRDEAAKPNKRYIRVKASSQYLNSTETADTAYAENRTCGNDGQVLEGETGSASKKKGRGEPPHSGSFQISKDSIEEIATSHGISLEISDDALTGINAKADSEGLPLARAALAAFIADLKPDKENKLYWLIHQWDKNWRDKGASELAKSEAENQRVNQYYEHQRRLRELAEWFAGLTVEQRGHELDRDEIDGIPMADIAMKSKQFQGAA